MYVPRIIQAHVPAPSVSLGTGSEPEDPAIAMADPSFDSRIAVVTPGALDLTCALIRRGFEQASLVRVDDRLPPHQADVVIIAQPATAAFLARAVPFARRLLAPMGVVVLRLAADRDDGLERWAREQLLLNGFTAIRVDTRRGETLLGAELPLHGRLGHA